MFTLFLQSLPDTPSSLHTQLIFLKNKAIKSNLCCSQTLGYAAFFSRMWSTPSEISGCSSYQLPTAPQLWVRLHARLPPPRLDLSGFSFCRSASAVPTVWVQLCPETSSLWSFTALGFDALSAPSFTMLPEPWQGFCSVDIPFKGEHSSILYGFLDLCLPGHYHQMEKEVSPLRAEWYLNLWV